MNKLVVEKNRFHVSLYLKTYRLCLYIEIGQSCLKHMPRFVVSFSDSARLDKSDYTQSNTDTPIRTYKEQHLREHCPAIMQILLYPWLQNRAVTVLYENIKYAHYHFDFSLALCIVSNTTQSIWTLKLPKKSPFLYLRKMCYAG